MVESAINLLVSIQGWIEGLAFRSNPLEDIAFESLRVITSGPSRTFAKLQDNIRQCHAYRSV
jgi:hypothetical protein